VQTSDRRLGCRRTWPWNRFLGSTRSLWRHRIHTRTQPFTNTSVRTSLLSCIAGRINKYAAVRRSYVFFGRRTAGKSADNPWPTYRSVADLSITDYRHRCVDGECDHLTADCCACMVSESRRVFGGDGRVSVIYISLKRTLVII